MFRPPQAQLAGFEQRQQAGLEEIEVKRVVVEADLEAVDAGIMRLMDLMRRLLRRFDDLDVAAENTFGRSVLWSGVGVAAGVARRVGHYRDDVGMVDDRIAIGHTHHVKQPGP